MASDHSSHANCRTGLKTDEAEVAEQGVEIARENRNNTGFAILRSIELNLNPRGEGDMATACLAGFDLVLAPSIPPCA